MQIRNATPADAAAIVAVHHATWQSEIVHAERIANALALDHIAHVAVHQDNKIVGYVDGFMTISASGLYRWEVDLLAVDPAYRGQGLASQLITASKTAGYEGGATLIRALVAAGNTPAEQSFRRCGFTPDRVVSQLCIASGDSTAHTETPADAYLLPVHTFTYSGIWVEGELSPKSLRLARWVTAHYGWDVAGAVIPTNQSAAVINGYEIVNQYHYWLL